jgi:hypothetical protein
MYSKLPFTDEEAFNMEAGERPDRADGGWTSRYFQAPQFDGLARARAEQFQIPDWYSKQYAHNLNLGIDIVQAWLMGGRKLVDTWRDSVRTQQDILLSGMRDQIEINAQVSEQSVSDAETISVPAAGARRAPRTAKQPQV